MDYYVRKSGNDTTGNGSTGNPWLTLQKAIVTLSAAGGDRVFMGDGTYQEDTSGTGYLMITKNFTNPITVQSESGIYSAVTIQGTSGTSYNVMYQNTLGGIVWNDVTFATRVKEIPTGAFRVARSLNLVFNRCKFSGLSDAAAQRSAFAISPGSGLSVAGVICNDCIFEVVGADLSYGVIAVPGAGTIDGVTFNNCQAVAVQYGLYVQQGCANVNVNGGSWANTGAGAGIIYGTDSEAPTGTISGTISGAAISSPASHACMIGCRSGGVVTVTGCTVSGGDYGIVVKENAGSVITGNTINGGTSASLYFKAATGATATGNRIFNAAGGYGIKAGVGGTGHQCQNLTVTGNLVQIRGAGGALAWEGDSGDAGGCVVNSNTYQPNGTASLGQVRADTSVLSMPELRAAWAGYGDGSNDGLSVISSGTAAAILRLVAMKR